MYTAKTKRAKRVLTSATMFGGGDHYGITVRNFTATSHAMLRVDTPTMVMVLTQKAHSLSVSDYSTISLRA
jgi:hypothetical protein